MTKDEQIGKMREALQACLVFITPIERRRFWNEYKEDASLRIRECLGEAGSQSVDEVERLARALSKIAHPSEGDAERPCCIASRALGIPHSHDCGEETA